MAYIIVVLFAVVGFQEWRIHRLVERMLLQANVPDVWKPTPASPPNAAAAAERIETRKKLFSLAVPR